MTGTKRTAVTLVVITVLLSLVIGVVGIVSVTGLSDTAAELKQHIIVQLQIPLILTACLVGAALSTSGATLQVVLRNPLADPGIIGITSGASLVAALLLLLTPQWATAYLHYLLPLGCFIGALLSTFIIYRLARKLLGSSTAVILAGIAISTLSGAVIAWLYMFSDANALRNLTFWLMGSLYQTNWLILSVGGPLIAVAVALQLYFAGDLNKLYAGELAAKSSGVDVEKLTERSLIACAIAVGTAVSMAGSIAFVGLLVPHILRLIIGHNNRYLLPLSALSGASLLMLVALSSEMTRAITLPVSMVTATLGGPLLIWALAKGQIKGQWRGNEMTTHNFRTQQRPDSGINEQIDERIDASEQDTIITNPKQNVSVKDDVADSNSPANSHNLADSHTVLSLQNVNVASRLSVEGLRAKKGECVHIIGPNGAGKSTLLLTLAGLIDADEGTVMLLGKPMNDWSLATLASVRTFLAQQSESGFHLSVKEYLSFYAPAQEDLLIPSVLEKALEVSGFLNKILTQLSGGERQRVEICRSLLQIWPQLERGEGVAFLDEPLQGLDIRHQYALASLVKFLCNKGNTILMTSHDIALSANYCDSLWLMQKGRMVAFGKSHEVATQTNLESVFECHFAISKHDNFLEIQVCAPISLE